MATIRVTPDLLRGKATDLRTQKDAHDTAMSQIHSIIVGTEEVFEGDAQRALVAKYESMQGTFTQFSELLESYAQMLDSAANAFEEQDASLSNAFQSFGV